MVWWWWWWIIFVVWLTDERRAFSLISSRDHCQRSSPSRISDTPGAGFEPAQNLSSGLVEWSCAVVITTAPLTHFKNLMVWTTHVWPFFTILHERVNCTMKCVASYGWVQSTISEKYLVDFSLLSVLRIWRVGVE